MKICSISIRLFLILLIILLFSLNASAQWEEIDLYLYYGDTSKDVTVAWGNPKITTPEDITDDYNVDTDVFQISMHNKERDIEVLISDTIPGDVFTHTFKLPKTGHWTPKIRVVRTTTDSEGIEIVETTAWVLSSNAEIAEVNGILRGWWLFGWLAPTGPIIPQ